jgi:hypothetical protein
MKYMNALSAGWICRHCPKNPTAIRPYIKLHYPKMNKTSEQSLRKEAKENLTDPSCYLCQVLREFRPRPKPSENLFQEHF